MDDGQLLPTEVGSFLEVVEMRVCEVCGVPVSNYRRHIARRRCLRQHLNSHYSEAIWSKFRKKYPTLFEEGG